jgi:arginine/serine-rich splicing factor 1/9
VEFPRASSRGAGSGSGGYRRPSAGFRPSNKAKGYQLLVSGLPPTGSWQDLKDHFRSAGDVVFTDSYNDGTGIVEFSRYEDFKRALRDMDDSKFRSHEVGYIR